MELDPSISELVDRIEEIETDIHLMKNEEVKGIQDDIERVKEEMLKIQTEVQGDTRCDMRTSETDKDQINDHQHDTSSTQVSLNQLQEEVVEIKDHMIQFQGNMNGIQREVTEVKESVRNIQDQMEKMTNLLTQFCRQYPLKMTDEDFQQLLSQKVEDEELKHIIWNIRDNTAGVVVTQQIFLKQLSAAPDDVQAIYRPLIDTKHIELTNMGITDEIAVALAEALKFNSTLTVLGLRDNNVSDRGCMALAEALKSNSSLALLGLRNNNVSDEGCIALAGALKSNSTLTALFLNNNKIGNQGGVALLHALKSNLSLKLCNLQSNDFSRDVKSAMKKSICKIMF